MHQWHNYHGPAVAPKHLSLYERLRGYGAGCACTKSWDSAGWRQRLPAQQRRLLPPRTHKVAAPPLPPHPPPPGKHHDPETDAEHRRLQDLADDTCKAAE